MAAQEQSVLMRLSKKAVRAGVIPPVIAATLGNALVGKASMQWFHSLVKPRMQIPMPAFLVVGAVYYVEMGVVLYRAARRADPAVRRWGWMVLAGNELWNAAFFARRSPRNGLLGLILFLGPLLKLLWSVRRDRRSVLALTPYTLWVLAYDLPWIYQLWRSNPQSARPART
jgi:tryptophan-rich sensory protein